MPRFYIPQWSGNFNGTDNFVAVGTGSGITTFNTYSWAFWFNVAVNPAAGNWAGMVTAGDSGTNKGQQAVGIVNGYFGTTGVQFRSHHTSAPTDDTNLVNTVTVPGLPTTNTWHHVLVTRNSTGNVQIAYDGIIRATQVVSAATAFYQNTTVSLGRRAGLGNYQGRITEMLFYEGVVLNVPQRKELYNTGTVGALNPTRYYKFIDGSGSTVRDQANVANGTWNGTLGSQWSNTSPYSLRGIATGRSSATGRSVATGRTVVT